MVVNAYAARVKSTLTDRVAHISPVAADETWEFYGREHGLQLTSSHRREQAPSAHLQPQREHGLQLTSNHGGSRGLQAPESEPTQSPALAADLNPLTQSESRRQGCLKIDLFSADRVLEFQKLRMQKISSIAGEPGEILQRLASQSIQRIAYQRMPNGCQMDSDLMGAPRMQAHLKCRCTCRA